MKKIATKMALLLMGGIILSGCAAKYVKEKCVFLPNIDKPVYTFEFASGDNSLTWDGKSEKLNAVTLQIAAEQTLDRGFKYFAFVYPKQISNVDGSLINTPEEFFKKCNSHFGYLKRVATLGFYSPTGKCGINTDDGGLIGRFAIIMYKKKPKDILVYDAKYVLDYLKKHGLYDNDKKLKEVKQLS
jgi:hypothetical protein